jgi:hypothetical protein
MGLTVKSRGGPEAQKGSESRKVGDPCALRLRRIQPLSPTTARAHAELDGLLGDLFGFRPRRARIVAGPGMHSPQILFRRPSGLRRA